MLIFSRVVEPSSLLWTQGLNRVASTLFAQCEDRVFLSQPGAMDRLWQRAQDLDEQGDPAGCAIVLISLAGIFRRCNRLGPALKCAQRAKEILGRWPHKHQKQNLAVALYACGLVHHFLGSYQEACECYDEALTVFEDAARQRRTLNVPAQFEQQCAKVERLLEELSTYVARAATCGDWGAIQFCSFMSYWLAERNPLEDVQPTLSIAFEPFAVDMALQQGQKRYGLELLGGGPVGFVPEADKEYGVVQVPPEIAQSPSRARAPSELQDAKYALFEEGIRTTDFGLGAELAKDDPLLWGKFVRDPRSGKISLVARYQDRPLPNPKYVGEDDLDPGASGAIIGVFK